MVLVFIFQGAATSVLADFCSGNSQPDINNEKMKKALKQERGANGKLCWVTGTGGSYCLISLPHNLAAPLVVRLSLCRSALLWLRGKVRQMGWEDVIDVNYRDVLTFSGGRKSDGVYLLLCCGHEQQRKRAGDLSSYSLIFFWLQQRLQHFPTIGWRFHSHTSVIDGQRV